VRADRPKIVGANFDPEANMQESLLGFRVADAESVGGAGFFQVSKKRHFFTVARTITPAHALRATSWPLGAASSQQRGVAGFRDRLSFQTRRTRLRRSSPAVVTTS